LGYSESQDLSLLEVDLMTGRTHQIRAHMASIGHPLLGEGKYGVNKSDRALGYSYQALYSYKLRFTVPDGYLAYLNHHTFSVPLTDVRFLEFFRLGDVKKKLDKK
jgi:23S rRNA pseudouridine955/2504/2580 synthase